MKTHSLYDYTTPLLFVPRLSLRRPVFETLPLFHTLLPASRSETDLCSNCLVPPFARSVLRCEHCRLCLSIGFVFICRLPFIDWLATIVAVMNDKLFICRLSAQCIYRLAAKRIYRQWNTSANILRYELHGGQLHGSQSNTRSGSEQDIVKTHSLYDYTTPLLFVPRLSLRRPVFETLPLFHTLLPASRSETDLCSNCLVPPFARSVLRCEHCRLCLSIGFVFICRLPFIDWLATIVAVMNDKLFICRLSAQRIYRIDARSLHYLAPLVGGIMLLSV